jgi:transposase
MQIAVLGIDLGKNSCSAVGLETAGRVVLPRRLSRDGLMNQTTSRFGNINGRCVGAHSEDRVRRC